MIPEDNDPEEVSLCRVPGRIAAEPIVAALRANGIEARTRGEAAGQIYGLTLDGMGEVTILVRADDEEAARELLKAADLGQLRLGDGPVADDRTERDQALSPKPLDPKP
jgi:hypothetical protein